MNKRTPISHSKYLLLSDTSEHFDYFFDESFVNKEKVLTDIKTILEKEIVRIADFFCVTEIPIFSVYIYPNINLLQEEIYGQTLPDWVTASGLDDGVATVDPSVKHNFKSYDRIISELPHELVHTFTFFNCKDRKEKYCFPCWFIEGLAVYLTDPTLGENKVIEKIKNGFFPPITDFEDKTGEEFDNNLGYYFSPSAIELLIERYGKDKIVEIIKNYNSEFYTVLGEDRKTFQTAWHAHLKKKYSHICS